MERGRIARRTQGDARSRARAAAPARSPRDVVLALQRGYGNAATARALAVRRPVLQRDELTVAAGFPEAEAGQMRDAWAILQALDADPATAEDVTRLTQIARAAGVMPNFLDESMLGRMRSLPNVELRIQANVGAAKDPSVAGGTALIAAYGGETQRDVGLLAEPKLIAFLQAVPEAERANVKFTIEIECKIPKYEWARREARQGAGGTFGVAYFLETLAHELALHAEKYVDLITNWRATGQTWRAPGEDQEHAEHMFAGNPRYMLLLTRLYAAAADPTFGAPPDLVAGLERELATSRTVYTRQRLAAPPGHEDRRMLDWIDELKQALGMAPALAPAAAPAVAPAPAPAAAPAPAPTPAGPADDPLEMPRIPRQARRSRLERLLDWLAGCVRGRQPD